MLGVDGIDAGRRFCQQSVHQIPGHHKCLFVGKGNVFAGFYGCYGRSKATVAHSGGYNGVYIVGGNTLFESGFASGTFDAERLQMSAQAWQQAAVGNYGQAWPVPRSQCCELVDTLAGGQHRGPVAFWVVSYYF